MKSNPIFVFLIIFCLCGGIFVLVSTGSPNVSVADPGTEIQGVKDVVDQFFAAARRQQWDAAGDLMSADFELYTDDAQSFNKEIYVQLLKADDIKTTNMELRDLEIRVSHDGQMAWCKYRGFFEASSQGKSSSVETAETLIFKKEDRVWKITRAHASVKPITAVKAAPPKGSNLPKTNP